MRVKIGLQLVVWGLEILGVLRKDIHLSENHKLGGYLLEVVIPTEEGQMELRKDFK